MKTVIDKSTNERLTILSEECAELIQVVCKVQRFGLSDPRTQDHLIQELGDVIAMVGIITQKLDIPEDVLYDAVCKKLEKLKKFTKY